MSERGPAGVAAVPPSVRLIRGATSWITRRRGLAVAAAAAVALLAWLAGGVYTVDNGESAVLLRFGRITDQAISPGLHLCLPGIDRVYRARTGDVLRLEIDADRSSELHLLTGDENLIQTDLVIQYRISGLSSYLLGIDDVEEVIRQVVRMAMVETVASLPVEDVLTSAKAAVQSTVRERSQDKLEALGAGVTMVSVSLQSVDPPNEAADAFRSVSDARSEAAEAVSKAEGRKARQLRLARGQAAQQVAAARAQADVRIQQARGAAGRFEQLLARSRVAPRQVRDELLAQTLVSTLPEARVIELPRGERPPPINLHLLPSGSAGGISQPDGVLRRLLGYDDEPASGGSGAGPGSGGGG
jgi:membrane protease subunit HflK